MINGCIYIMCKPDYTKYERVAFPCPSDKILSLKIIYLVTYIEERVAFPSPFYKILSLKITYLVTYKDVHVNDIQHVNAPKIFLQCN